MAETRVRSSSSDYKLKWEEKVEVPILDPHAVVSIEERVYVAGGQG